MNRALESGALLYKLTVMSLCCLLTACGNLLPTKHEAPELPWSSFEDVKHVYDLILPNTSTVHYLHEQGVDPYVTPNIAIVSYLDIQEKFVPNSSINVEELDPAVRTCLKHRASCYGYAMAISFSKTERVGNTMLDIMDIRKTTVREGWKFEALFVIDKFDGQDVVVYKVWRGAPKIKTTEKNRNPLGPLNKSDIRDLLSI